MLSPPHKTITCANTQCSVKLFHLSCLRMKSVPKRKWQYPTCRRAKKAEKVAKVVPNWGVHEWTGSIHVVYGPDLMLASEIIFEYRTISVDYYTICRSDNNGQSLIVTSFTTCLTGFDSAWTVSILSLGPLEEVKFLDSGWVYFHLLYFLFQEG